MDILTSDLMIMISELVVIAVLLFFISKQRKKQKEQRRCQEAAQARKAQENLDFSLRNKKRR